MDATYKLAQVMPDMFGRDPWHEQTRLLPYGQMLV
jgi:hypothetical protein